MEDTNKIIKPHTDSSDTLATTKDPRKVAAGKAAASKAAASKVNKAAAIVGKAAAEAKEENDNSSSSYFNIDIPSIYNRVELIYLIFGVGVSAYQVYNYYYPSKVEEVFTTQGSTPPSSNRRVPPNL